MTYKRKRNYWQQDIPIYDYWKGFAKGCAIIIIISYLFYGNLIYAILFSPYLVKYMKSWERQVIKKKREEFCLQFKNAIQVLSASIRVGYSVENAIEEAIKELKHLYKDQAIIIKEFTYIARQTRMNVPVESALWDFAKRTDEEDVKTFAMVFGMAKRNGGDTVDIIQNTTRQLMDKIDVEREIRTIMAAKQLEFRIMTVIPLGMMTYLKISFPEFLNVLYGNLVGVIIMSVCLAIYLFSYEAGKRIVEVEV